jgi:hypothetical protein
MALVSEAGDTQASLLRVNGELLSDLGRLGHEDLCASGKVVRIVCPALHHVFALVHEFRPVICGPEGLRTDIERGKEKPATPVRSASSEAA